MAMMFLIIFGSLGVAMAIVAQGNLSTAEAHIKINRSLAAAETGMQYMIYRINQTAQGVTTTAGVIDSTNAPALWIAARDAMKDEMTDEAHNVEQPVLIGTTLKIGPIAVAPGEPTFEAYLTPHPITGEDYGAPFYQNPPYSELESPPTSGNTLDATWVRVRVVASDGPVGRQVFRSIQMDFKMDKKIRYAILARSRVMIGRNVMIDGPIGSRFLETWLENGHPVQMVSDFRGLDTDETTGLDVKLDDFMDDELLVHDVDGDNRINLANATEAPAADLADLTAMDANEDGYVDEYDLFISHFDTNDDGQITSTELHAKADSTIEADQLLELIDTFGDPSRSGYGDSVIDVHDPYAKIRGEVLIKADVDGWELGAAAEDNGDRGNYQDYFQGPIHPDYGEAPLTFGASDYDMQQLGSTDFDVSSFKTAATGDLAAQATTQELDHDPMDPESPQPLGNTETEEVPYGAAYPYDYYERPVYENMTFTDVTIPKGTNALFRNCTFIGVTFVETEVQNTDANFNYAGMVESDGTQKYPDLTVDVGGTDVTDTKTVANNLRFDHCTFEGAIVSDAPPGFSHVRNKIAFTGQTQFEIEGSSNLTATEKATYKRSTILTPHYSIEMGTFLDPNSSLETVDLSGTIVAGVLDMRGQIEVNGTILTTFEPETGVTPVLGDTSPQFNTTLGYFSSESGDIEAELPAEGVGVIKVTYDPSLALPDGINGSIEIAPLAGTYYESGE